MTPQKGPTFDRFLMRSKDIVLLAGVLMTLIKWFYITPLQTQDRVDRQEKQLKEITDVMKAQSEDIKTISRNIERLFKRTGLDR